MKRRILSYLLLSCLSVTTYAAELTPYTASKVVKANQLAQENKVKEAIQILKQAELSRSYDRAYVARMLGVFYWQNEQIPAAIASLKLAVESNELQDDQAWTTRKMLADLDKPTRVSFSTQTLLHASASHSRRSKGMNSGCALVSCTSKCKSGRRY